MSLEQPSRGRTDQTADPSPSVPGPRDVAAVDLRAWLAAVGEVAREDNWNASLDGLVSRITATCCQLLNYDFCLIMLVDGSRQRLIVEGGYGLSAEFIARYNAQRPVLLGTGPHGAGPVRPALTATQPLDPAAANELRLARGYFQANAARMEYPRFRALDLPLGSGAVESLAKHLVQRRLKRAGMRWSEPGGEMLLAHRASNRPLPARVFTAPFLPRWLIPKLFHYLDPRLSASAA